MIWFAIGFLTVTGAAIIAARSPLARMQSEAIGGKVPPGCIVLQGALILLMAAAMLWFRGLFQ